ncbi:MAG: GAF domain-containing protein [Chloroflexi bacterium]|nr:GAF domain-containing protein [Chloroflexota bacterium]
MDDKDERLASYEREIRRLNQLVEVSLAINSTLDLRPLLRAIMDYAAGIADAESASVMLLDRTTGQLRFVASTTASRGAGKLLDIHVPLEGSLAGAVLLENREIVLDDVSTDPRHFRQADQQSGFVTRSLIGVPMRYRDDVIGVLEAVNKRAGPWTADDRHNLLILASQAAVAISNAQMIDQLKKAYHELDQLDKLKNDFIAIASHELRTPLSVIVGYATFLKEDTTGTVGKHAEAVLNSALRMRSLIEDMTNLRYLKQGETDLRRARVPLADLFTLARSDVERLAGAKGHTLRVHQPEPSLVVTVDRDRMVMALTNVLNNAIKFTPSGGQITLSYQLQPGAVWIVVEDTGIGIPRAQLERIFEEFLQVEDHMTRQHGGLGLGWPLPARWSRLTVGESGRRATGRIAAAGSPSACRCPPGRITSRDNRAAALRAPAAC